MNYRGKVFTSKDNKTVALVTAQWDTADGQFVRLGNGNIITTKEFETSFKVD